MSAFCFWWEAVDCFFVCGDEEGEGEGEGGEEEEGGEKFAAALVRFVRPFPSLELEAEPCLVCCRGSEDWASALPSLAFFFLLGEPDEREG